MRFAPTHIAGVVELTIEFARDDRGGFGRIFWREEFAEHGLPVELAQCSLSRNPRKGTVRGFHLQAPPHAEAKLVQCISGAMFDVALDLRPGSQTYGRHHALVLSAEDERMVFIPEGCAHAFQTLSPDTRILYYISTAYAPESTLGVRWDDPALGIKWPITESVTLSKRDRSLPLLADYRASA
jgi:dTDP-4-dehydrorhamnose 3,5-epimerase